MTTVDAQGNIHDRTGQFAQKNNAAPAGGLSASTRTAEDEPDPRVTEAFDELGGGEARYIHDIDGLPGRYIGIESVYPRFEGPHAREQIIVRIQRNSGGVADHQTFDSRAGAEAHVRGLIASTASPAQV